MTQRPRLLLRGAGVNVQREAGEDTDLRQRTWELQVPPAPIPLDLSAIRTWHDAPDMSWATRGGHDGFGFWAAIDLEGATFRMRWVEPGSFMMGSPDDEKGRYESARGPAASRDASPKAFGSQRHRARKRFTRLSWVTIPRASRAPIGQ